MATKKSTTSSKTTAKRTTRSAKPRTTSSEMKKTPMTKSETPARASSQTKSVKVSRRNLIAVIAAIFVVGLLYYFRSFFLVATVNGQPITRITFIQEMENQQGQTGVKSGTQALNTVVTKALILQEAKKKNVTVSDEEINAELAKVDASLKGSGQTLDQALAAEGMTKADYSKQLKYQKLVEKMAASNVTVTDKDVETYMEQNKDSLPTTTEASEAASLKTSIKSQLLQQKQSEKIQSWLAGLQKNAKIVYFVKF